MVTCPFKSKIFMDDKNNNLTEKDKAKNIQKEKNNLVVQYIYESTNLR